MTYETPGAIRMALERRLQARSDESGIGLDRLRRRVLLERIIDTDAPPIALPSLPESWPGRYERFAAHHERWTAFKGDTVSSESANSAVLLLLA